MDKPTFFRQPTVGVGLAIFRAFLAAPAEAREALLDSLDSEMRARISAWAAGNERGQE